LSYLATDLPKGLSIDSETGLISGFVDQGLLGQVAHAVNVTVADSHGGTSSATFSWTIHNSLLVGETATLSATEGQWANNLVAARFSDADPSKSLSDYEASVGWGDGTTTVGRVLGTYGDYRVEGDHLYLNPGVFTVTTRITKTNGSAVNVISTATVGSVALVA